MYVIFPADELIFMTYGAAIPRLQPRPTLDNLREPLVPTGTRPNSSRPHLDDSYDTQSRNHQSYPPIQSNYRDRSLSRSSAVQQDYQVEDTNFLGIPEEETNYGRERSPSVTFEPPSPIYSNPSSSSTKAIPTGKKKHKLHLKLGSLGRHAQLPETARIKEDHHIHVANPTFTRENLRERNYDAFFDSGEPVYHIERRTRAPSQPLEPESALPPLPGLETNRPHSHTFGFLHRSKPSPVTVRAKSVEVETLRLEVSQKGDRCPLLKFLV